jgi:hypothetical protein
LKSETRSVAANHADWLFAPAVDKVLSASDADRLYDRVGPYLPATSVFAAAPSKFFGNLTPKVFTKKA